MALFGLDSDQGLVIWVCVFHLYLCLTDDVTHWSLIVPVCGWSITGTHMLPDGRSRAIYR